MCVLCRIRQYRLDAHEFNRNDILWYPSFYSCSIPVRGKPQQCTLTSCACFANTDFCCTCPSCSQSLLDKLQPVEFDSRMSLLLDVIKRHADGQRAFVWSMVSALLEKYERVECNFSGMLDRCLPDPATFEMPCVVCLVLLLRHLRSMALSRVVHDRDTPGCHCSHACS